MQWAMDRNNASKVRMLSGWANSVSSRRALIMPVWRTAPSAEAPQPANDFNGVLAIVVDINRFVEVYLGPAMNEMSDARLVVGLATPQFGVRMGPGGEGVAPDAGRCAQPRRTAGHDGARRRRGQAAACLVEARRRR